MLTDIGFNQLKTNEKAFTALINGYYYAAVANDDNDGYEFSIALHFEDFSIKPDDFLKEKISKNDSGLTEFDYINNILWLDFDLKNPKNQNVTLTQLEDMIKNTLEDLSYFLYQNSISNMCWYCEKKTDELIFREDNNLPIIVCNSCDNELNIREELEKKEEEEKKEREIQKANTPLSEVISASFFYALFGGIIFFIATYFRFKNTTRYEYIEIASLFISLGAFIGIRKATTRLQTNEILTLFIVPTLVFLLTVFAYCCFLMQQLGGRHTIPILFRWFISFLTLPYNLDYIGLSVSTMYIFNILLLVVSWKNPEHKKDTAD